VIRAGRRAAADHDALAFAGQRVALVLGPLSAVASAAAPLKLTVRAGDIHRVEHDGVHGEPPPGVPGLGAGSAPAPPRLPWWAAGPIRLTLLLAFLAVAVAGLLTKKVTVFDSSSSGGDASAGVFLPRCPRLNVPEARRVPPRDLAALRDSLSPIMPRWVGRVYETGTVAPSNLWSDNAPVAPSSGSPDGPVPAGWEIRWWALNRDGDEDDVVADVLEFPTPREAENALSAATSSRCRQAGAAHPAPFPSGARNVFWVNPDDAPEWDVLFVRRRRLYRVADVPPGYLQTEPPPAQRHLERLRVLATVDLLACSLPEADCPGSTASPHAAGQASLAAGPPDPSGAPGPITRAQALAYAHAVNLRAFFLTGMTQTTQEGTLDAPTPRETTGGCTGEVRSLRSVVAVHSPVFAYSARSVRQSVYSTVVVLPNAGEAARYLAVLASARTRACIAHSYRRRLLNRYAESGRLRLGPAIVTPLPAPAPARYRGPGPYRGTMLRATLQATYTTRRGRRVQMPLYIDAFVFAYGRVAVGFVAESLYRPFPQVNERFLTSTLVGRAEANRL
jgi:hypothetical protein